MRLKISSRKSDLAKIQAYMVGDALIKTFPGTEIEYRFKESLGDINLHEPLWKIPEKGVFTEDFHKELLSQETDMVVHSWKDLPTELKETTFIAATLPRADQRDLLLFKNSSIQNSKKDVRIFSSSPRRSYNLTSFLAEAFPFETNSIQFESVRGNVPTRIRKLIEDESIDGLIVAKAALDRLLTAPQAEFADTQVKLREYLKSLNWMVLPLSVNPNAAAQGALAIEIRKDRKDLIEILQKINHQDTFFAATEERIILKSFGGGCHQKIGAALSAKKFGWIESLQGLTDAGQVLDKYYIRQTQSIPQFSKSEIWSQSLANKDYFHRVNKDMNLSCEGVFVSKAEAWNSKIKAKYIWSAGVTTWKKLAKQGVWVHGSSDSMGEADLPQIDELVGKQVPWVKVTHNLALENKSAFSDCIATYELSRNAEKFDLSGKKSFYWGSFSLFQAAISEFPEIINAHHACGPGSTFDSLHKYFTDHNLDHTRLNVFLSEPDWRQHVTL